MRATASARPARPARPVTPQPTVRPRSAARARPRTGLDVLEQLRVVVRLAGAHSAHLERTTGLPGAQLWALHEIASHDALSVGDLAERLRLRQATVSNLLHRLEDRGLVRKGRSPADQRVVELHLTPAGRKALKSSAAHPRGLLPNVLEGLSAAQLRKVYDGLAVLLDRMGGVDPAMAGKPLPFNE